MYLARYHDVSISSSGVWRILKRLDLNRLPASQRCKRLDRRWSRYEEQLGHQVQIDVKFIASIAGAPKRASTASSRHRRLHRAPGPVHLPRLNQKTAIQFADDVLEKLPFQVQEIPTDNGPEFGSSFHYLLLDKGVGHR